jgi:hypothetical protein
MRRRQPADDLRSTRKSRTFYAAVDPALQQRVQALSYEGYYTFLLYRDLDQVIPFPIGRSSSPPARIAGPDADQAAPLIEQALSGQDWPPSLSESIRRFVNSTAQHLVISGPVTYEIDYLYSAQGTSDTPAGFRLELVTPGTMSYHQDQPIQYVPAAHGGRQDKTGLTYVELDPATLITFRLDPADEAPVRKMMRFLRAANALQGAGASLLERAARGRTTYSFAEHQRKQAELFAEATRHIGWTPGWSTGGLFQHNHLPPYDVWRQLRFLEFKIRTRNVITGRLNAALANIGSRLGFQATIELTGLPTLQDVDNARDDLQSGHRSLSDLATFAV